MNAGCKFFCGTKSGKFEAKTLISNTVHLISILMSDTFQIFNGQDYWKDRPGTCQFCTHARPQFNGREYGGEQLLDSWWCELHRYSTVNHGCPWYMREPGIEG